MPHPMKTTTHSRLVRSQILAVLSSLTLAFTSALPADKTVPRPASPKIERLQAGTIKVTVTTETVVFSIVCDNLRTGVRVREASVTGPDGRASEFTVWDSFVTNQWPVVDASGRGAPPKQPKFDVVTKLLRTAKDGSKPVAASETAAINQQLQGLQITD